MAVFRIEKTKDYTVMSNHHLRNTALSLKAKGMLSLMLSLPENWDYTTKGLAAICKDGIDSICSTIKELEKNGYVIRRRLRNTKGHLTETEYTILEYPKPQEIPDNLPKPENPVLEEYPPETPKPENPILDNPVLGKPILEKPEQENPVQLNTKELNKEGLITDVSSTNQSICPSDAEPLQSSFSDSIDAVGVYRQIIKDNIEYNCLSQSYDVERLDEIIELMLEVICSPKKTFRIEKTDFPAEIVKNRMMKINQFHVEYVFECMDRNTAAVRNIKNYLLTVLYNASATMGHYYQSQVNHDLFNN